MISKRRVEDYVVVFDNMLSDGFALIIALIWFTAWFNGGTATVKINSYGESVPELVLWPVIFAIVFWGTYIRLKRGVKNVEEAQ
jgi:hypothetical protein